LDKKVWIKSLDKNVSVFLQKKSKKNIKLNFFQPTKLKP